MSVGVKTGLSLHPADLLFEVKLRKQVAKSSVGQEGDVVMAVPGDIAELPFAGESAKLPRALKDRDALPALREAKRHGHSQDAAAHDAPMFFRVSHPYS